MTWVDEQGECQWVGGEHTASLQVTVRATPQPGSLLGGRAVGILRSASNLTVARLYLFPHFAGSSNNKGLEFRITTIILRPVPAPLTRIAMTQ
jgi:hypothetical protein